MRITTILGVSLCLAAGIALGIVIGTVKTNTPFPIPHATITPINSPPPEITQPPVAIPRPHFDHAQVERLLLSSRPLEALALLSEVSPDIDLSTTEGADWIRLLITVYAATNNTPQLLLIYRQMPAAFSSNEEASLMIADTLMAQGDTTEYRRLRRQWLGRETEKARWVFLDAQESITMSKPAEAVTILSSNSFHGKDETERLVRLAALYVINDPKKAWNYLSEAAQKDPSDADLFTFRASLGEKLKQHDTATADYITAVRNDRENPYRREQLADFYLRIYQYQPALKVLEDAMPEPSLDTIWLKTLFWNRVVGPYKRAWSNSDIPRGPLSAFDSYLNALPAGTFWDQSSFERVPNAPLLLETVQETFWMRLLAALKEGDEGAAHRLVATQPFLQNSFQTELLQAIGTLLTFRKTSTSTDGHLAFPQAAAQVETPQQLLSLLSNLAEASPEEIAASIPNGVAPYLLSDDSFVIPFLAAGWTEAGLQLRREEVLPDTFPDWIAVSIAEALSTNRSAAAALEFAGKQTSTQPLSLFIAKLALSTGQKQLAFDALKGIYTEDTPHGQQAALLLGQFLMENDNSTDAKKVLLSHPTLADNAAAREMLARIAVQEGDMDKAYALYLKLESQSSEAKSFLARKAFTDKDWSRAKQLTEQLLKEFPDNPTLLTNLKKIVEEEKRQQISKKR